MFGKRRRLGVGEQSGRVQQVVSGPTGYIPSLLTTGQGGIAVWKTSFWHAVSELGAGACGVEAVRSCDPL